MELQIFSVFLILGGSVLAQTKVGADIGKFFPGAPNWDYSSTDRWVENYPLCGGPAQSPVDLRSSATVVDPGRILMAGYNTSTFGNFTIKGGSLKFEAAAEVVPFIYGGRFPHGERFLFAALHWHWGKDSERGSEHTVDGKPYAMAMHLVHKNSKYPNLTSALQHADGLAVLEVHYVVSKEDNPKLRSILDVIETVENLARTQKTVKMPFSVILREILPKDTTNYFYYQGSLTTPTCNEAVLWTNFLQPFTISEAQLDKFRRLKDSKGLSMSDNFRPGQALNGRTVFLTECAGGDSCCSSSFPCGLGGGDCDTDADCQGNLVCGTENCPNSSLYSFDSTDDCCQDPVDPVDPSLLDFLASQEKLLEAGSSTSLRKVSSNLSHGLARMAELQDRLVERLLNGD